VSLGLRALAFLTFFFVDVGLRAAENLPEYAFELPRDCSVLSSECAVRTTESKTYRLNVGMSSVTLGVNSSVLRRSGAEVTVLEGEFWFIAPSLLRIRDPFGEIEVSDSNAEFFVKRTHSKLLVQVAKGEVRIRPKGTERFLTLSKGLENWLGPVNKGHGQLGFPNSIAIRPFVNTWANFYEGTPQEFRTEVSEFVSAAQEASNNVSDLQKATVERNIASAKESANAAPNLAKKQSFERKKFRALYWKKAFE
jgi:hypothetical protein